MAKRIDKQDSPADIELKELLKARTSFIMVAGAGSGKTTSLVKALDYLLKTFGEEFRRNKQKVACITYTTGAVAEILEDVSNDNLLHVSTIHSFLWEIARPFQTDIKIWVKRKIEEKLAELIELSKGFGPKVQQKTKDKNASDQEKLVKQLADITSVEKFKYEAGSDFSKGLIGHSDLTKLACSLINEKPLLRAVIANKYPFIFVDESQDTLPDFIESLVTIQQEHGNKFCVGFFGDPMQKIYATGAGKILKREGWKEVNKPENFRCPKEVLYVINNLRFGIDEFQQTGGRMTKQGEDWVIVTGSAHLFILPADENRDAYIRYVKNYLSRMLSDELWNSEERDSDLKMLMIEHRMAASRLKFPNLFSAFKENGNESLSTAFSEGDSWTLRPFLDYVLPLIDAYNTKQNFKVVELLRLHCPKFSKEALLEKNNAAVAEIFSNLKNDIEHLSSLFASDSTAKIKDVILYLNNNNVIAFDERYTSYLDNTTSALDDLDAQDITKVVLDAMLECPANEIRGYQTYINDESPYSTQHSVKGAEFSRVIVVLDDEEGKKSNLYSYEKLFGIKELSKTDNDNIASGKDSVIDRTKRLLYVCCSRSTKDLAVIFFVQDVELATTLLKKKNVFREDHILNLEHL